MPTAVVALVIALAAPLDARADVLAPPPASCPEGSAGMDCHGAPTCTIETCATDGDCGAGRQCADRALCTEEHCCSGRLCGDPSSPRFTHVIGACSASRTCVEGACTTMRVCVAGAPVDAGGTDSGTASDSGSDSDSGPADPDSGPADLDSGTTETDSGSASIDSGRAEIDGGTPPSGRGGCCSVIGQRDAGAIVMLASALFVAIVARRRR
jgi:hypothetical protein